MKLTCPFCNSQHEYRKAKHLIAFYCPNMGIIHWTHYTNEEVEEAKKEMAPFNWKTALIQEFFGKKEAKNDNA